MILFQRPCQAAGIAALNARHMSPAQPAVLIISAGRRARRSRRRVGKEFQGDSRVIMTAPGDSAAFPMMAIDNFEIRGSPAPAGWNPAGAVAVISGGCRFQGGFPARSYSAGTFSGMKRGITSGCSRRASGFSRRIFPDGTGVELRNPLFTGGESQARRF